MARRDREHGGSRRGAPVARVRCAEIIFFNAGRNLKLTRYAGITPDTHRSHNIYYGKQHVISKSFQLVVTLGAARDQALLVRLFMVIRDETIQEPYAPAGAPARIDVVAGAVHGRAGQIDVGPGRVLDEALQERRSGA